MLRQMRWKQPKQYMAKVAEGAPVQEEFSVETTGLTFEFMMNALRLHRGFYARLFELPTSLPLITITSE